MKNFLLFIIDSLNYSHVKEHPELMPFLDKISKSSIVCTNMFSQAPYTEAAVMNIYCGQNVLDNGGYLKRFKHAPHTVFEIMKEHGFTTYYNSFQPQCYPSSLRRGIDYIYYNVGYDLSALWSYRLYHYADLYVKKLLNDDDWANLIDIFDDNFSEWLLFINDIIDSAEACSMIIENAPQYDALNTKNELMKEYEKYQAEKKEYILSVLTESTNHNLFKLPAFIQTRKIKDRDRIPQIQALFKPLIKDIQHQNLKLNLKNGKGFANGPIRKFKTFVRKPSKDTYKNLLKSIYLSLNLLFDFDLKQRLSNDFDSFKNAPSAKTHIDHYMNWIQNHSQEKTFACIHVDDIHNPEEFFTYDSSDMELLQSEVEMAKQTIGNLPRGYSGSISHDLSLRYIDSIIEYLFNQLDTSGILEDTCVMITADHGFSFSGNPLRDSFVINLYLENYNVPFVIYNSGLPDKQIAGIQMTKDIPATIYALAGITDKIKGLTGQSVVGGSGHEFAMIEYCGGGCPDLSRRELKIAAFDKEYFVGTLCSLNDYFGWDKVTEVYDLNKDPKQEHNLSDQRLPDKYNYLYEAIGRRLADLKKQQS